jgi:hypothetical protein
MSEAQAAGTATNDAGEASSTATATASQAAAAGTAADAQASAAAATTQNTDPEDGAGKTDDAAKAEVVYDFAIPEGVELDVASTDEFKAIAKELSLPKDAAQKVMDLAVKREQARADAFAKQISDWGDAVRADKVLGVPENQALARKAIDTFGTPELKSMFNTTGMGNHPEVVRLAYAVGKALSEDKVVVNGQGGKPHEPKNHAAVLYS